MAQERRNGCQGAELGLLIRSLSSYSAADIAGNLILGNWMSDDMAKFIRR